MTARRPPGVSVEDWRERQRRPEVSEALARGDLDDLPGAGRPIPGLDRPLSALGWAVAWARREGGDLTAALPLALAMRREREQLVDAVPTLVSEAAVRALVADFNARLDAGYRRPQGEPPLATPFVDVERQVALWRAARPAPARPVLGTSAGAEEGLMPTTTFDTAYEALLARWPQPVEVLDVDTALGRTRVHAAGPTGAPPVLLLPGGGACSPVWGAVATALAGEHRVLALDVPGAAGRSAAPRVRVRHRDQVARWLEEVLDGIGADRAAVVGHSYGAWLALVHAIHHPERVRRLVLLDPTDCFVPLAPAYLARALPLFLAPTPRRHRAFLGWENGGRDLDEDLAAMLAQQGRPAVLLRPRRPADLDLQGLGVRVDVLVAALGRAHDPASLARRARALLPDATIASLDGVGHHELPLARTEHLVAVLREVLADER